MMLRFRTVFSLLLGTLPVAIQALDLTPIENWREQEGVRISTLLFNDPAGKIRYQPPAGWRFHGDSTALSLYPPEQEAFMQMRLFLRTAEQIAAAAAGEDLAKWTQSFLPPDAADIKVSSERPSPFTLSGQPSHEYVYDYKSGAQRFQTGVAVCDLDERQRLVVIITARVVDFPAVHDTGIVSLFSWSRRK